MEDPGNSFVVMWEKVHCMLYFWLLICILIVHLDLSVLYLSTDISCYAEANLASITTLT